jgi:hypothetical protein
MRVSGVKKTSGLVVVHDLSQGAVEEGILDIQQVNGPGQTYEWARVSTGWVVNGLTMVVKISL